MYWAAAQLQPSRTRLALHCLALAGFVTYTPRLRVRRARRGRDVEAAPLLFPGYAFVAIELQWRAAHYCPGVLRLVQDGQQPARVPDAVITELRGRERDGLIELPKPRVLRVGDPVRVLRGPFAGHLALYDGMQPRDRVAILVALLGGQQRVTLPKVDIEIVPTVSYYYRMIEREQIESWRCTHEMAADARFWLGGCSDLDLEQQLSPMGRARNCWKIRVLGNRDRRIETRQRLAAV